MLSSDGSGGPDGDRVTAYMVITDMGIADTVITDAVIHH
jgi:hypothetical protein